MKHRKRLGWLCVAGLALIAVVAGYIEFHFHLPEGTGPAGSAVSLEPFQQIWTLRKILLLGVGDSVTAGFGARRGYGYFDRLLANPVDELEDMRGRSLTQILPNVTARNMAVSGSNSLQHLNTMSEATMPFAGCF